MFTLDDVEDDLVIAGMNEEERHRARIRLIRTFIGAEQFLGDHFLAVPEPVNSSAFSPEGRRERALAEAERSENITYHDRLFLYQDLYERAKVVYPVAIPRLVANARRRLRTIERRRGQGHETIASPRGELPNFVDI